MLPLYLALTACTVAFGVVVFIQVKYRIREREETEGMWQRLATTRAERLFEQKEVADLPEIVQRYFLNAIRPGTPVARSVVLRMKGEIRLKNWTPFEAEQVLSPPEGFVWRARAGSKLIWFSGADSCIEEDALTRFALWGLVPIVNASGEDIARSSIGRMAGESILIPSWLLPRSGAQWKEINAQTAEVAVTIGEEPVALRIAFEANAMPKYVLFRRWYDRGVQRKWDYTPFGAEFSGILTTGGYTIPRSVRAGWNFGTSVYHEMFRATIETAEFR